MSDAPTKSGAEVPKEEPSARMKWARRVARVVLLVLGVSAIVALVSEAGPDNVLQTILRAGVWLPVVLLLEGAWISMDAVALRLLLGERAAAVPMRVWVRTALVAYYVMILLPAGRAGGEVARAAGLSPYLGGARAAAGAARLQASTLLGNTLISIPCYVAVAMAVGAGDALGWMVLLNGLVTGVVGSLVILASRRSRVGTWLGKRISFLRAHGSSFDDALRDQTPYTPAIMATFAGRMVQALQYGIILVAVGGSLTLVSALVSQGIHLVGAGLGDMVPNQVGVTEGAYRLFAPALGLQSEPARAIGIALVARIVQFALAGGALVVTSIWKPAATASAEPVST